MLAAGSPTRFPRILSYGLANPRTLNEAIVSSETYLPLPRRARAAGSLKTNIGREERFRMAQFEAPLRPLRIYYAQIGVRRHRMRFPSPSNTRVRLGWKRSVMVSPKRG